MKKLIFYFVAILIGAFLITAQGCKKKKDDTGTCKTCKALARGPDEQTVSKEVCGTQAEQDFRSQYSGREITCQ